ncbi:hypothetical protein WOLCODRAFT_165603 [Wolfiporia cocos MD-104 SS10]|uniref:Uncharacterized protein n=1 Tax=Wolfiporia cocos (strain MD-104) TaxID=742152 RepID=A0A2H3JSG9_WOLCO|nr:hypothetical protein WOLCODRAFT_165603 [Wolfiporia cocos MD-104 SS10]
MRKSDRTNARLTPVVDVRPVHECFPHDDEVRPAHTQHHGRFHSVAQRHAAACLAMMLPRVPQLSHFVRSGQLIGHGRRAALPRKADQSQSPWVLMIVVAEDDLDFPACDLVVRFYPLQHMVGYLQSCGLCRP